MKRGNRTLSITYCALGAALMAVCAMISIPAAIPFTLQTFAVFFLLRFLGGADSLKALAVYCALGAVGLPVFSGMKGGVGALFGATGGYILGFFFPALLLLLFEKLALRGALPYILSAALGLLLCYAFGTAWFMVVFAGKSSPMALSKALSLCVTPFILPDAAKAALGLMLGARLKKIIHPSSTGTQGAPRHPQDR